MFKYLFILGQSPQLAQAELKAILESDNNQLELIGQNFVLAQTKKSAEKLMNILGGTVKIARYLKSIPNIQELTTDLWYDILKNNLDIENKNHFGFSLYNDTDKNYQTVRKVGFQLKKIIQDNGYKSRLVTGQAKELSSVIVAKNKLLGRELIIIKNKESYLLGLTEAVQNFALYGFRDMERPYRDNKSGMLPPKVAQMLINLTGHDINKSILDPFCGSGTILQEAMLLGYKKIYGSDISAKAVQETKANLDWLTKNFSLQAEIAIKQADIKNIDQYFTKNSIDLIVSEPFMGDARFIIQQKNSTNLSNVKNDLQNLYYQAFEKFKKILSADGLIVFIFPVFDINNQNIYTLDKTKISALGFIYQLKDDLIYSRPDQKVKRQITVWKIKK